jgi:predicted ribonuclease toxin of YeeF-YezG toxin-antitoxin module
MKDVIERMISSIAWYGGVQDGSKSDGFLKHGFTAIV